MGETIKVSVIIPAYNASRYLRECLDSVIAQTLKQMEVLCVDDGSTDDTLAIMREYAARDSRIKVISGLNGGYGHAMNVGLDNAIGEYIGIIESDDHVPSNMYEELYTVASANDAEIVCADYFRFWGDGSRRIKLPVHVTPKGNYGRIVNPQEDISLFDFVLTWTGLYKRSFINAYGIRYFETPGASFQDYGIWYKTFTRVRRLLFIPKAYYMYRQDNPGSSFVRKDKIYAPNEQYALIRTFLRENPDIEKRYIKHYHKQKYGAYRFRYQYLAEEDKLAYLMRVAEEFLQAKKAGELDLFLFNRFDRQDLIRTMNDPEGFFRSYAKTRSLSFIPRAFLSVIRNLHDNGIQYTLQYAKLKYLSRIQG